MNLISKANIPIIADNATVADAKLTVSIIDKAANITANTPMAIVREMIAPFASLASQLTEINTAKQALTIAIAPIAFFNPDGSSRLIMAIAAASKRNATPIFIIIVPALSAYIPASLDTNTNADTSTLKPATIFNPFFKSSVLIPAMIFIVAEIRSNPTPIFIIIAPALSACSPPNFDIATKPTTKYSKAVITAMPLNKSLADIEETNFITPTRIKKATLIFISILPTSLRPVPANFDTAIRPPNKILKAPITMTPLPTPFVGILAKIFIATEISNRAAPNFIAIFPASSIFPISNFEDSFMNAMTIKLKVRITATPLYIPSVDIPSIIFTHHATISNAAPKLKKNPLDTN